MAKILFGADPECAALDFNGNAIPPYYFRKVLGVQVAEEDERHPVFIIGDGFKVHEDGANFEFSVRPSHNPRELYEQIQAARHAADSQILSRFGNLVLPTLQFKPTVAWDVDRWNAAMISGEVDPEEFNMSTRFGCDPDEDIFDTNACKVMDVKNHPWRYCGGHIHVSGSKKIAEDHDMAIRCMVMTAGIAAIAFSPWPELEKARTFRYGRPGKFRVQNYGRNNPFGEEYSIGVEYRTVSATWAGDWSVAEPVLKWAEIGITILLENGLGAELSNEIIKPACEAILSANQELARQLLSHVESKL